MLQKQNYIPEPEVFKAEFPLSPAMQKIKVERDEEIRAVLSGGSEKMLVVVGPCSAHESASTVEYVSRLGKMQERLKDRLVIVPRVYTNKPRTKGVGYQGMFSEIGKAGEVTRQVASGVDAPVGMKNPMSGNIPALLHSIYAAQSPQVFKYRNYQVRSSGNPYAHAVLRGGVDGSGADVPNFHYETVMKVEEAYRASGLKNPAIIIDCNHSNSGKRHRRQIEIALEVMQSRKLDEKCKAIVKGFMIESFLEEGNQLRGDIFGKSITDPCIGWSDTERLLCDLAELV